MHCKVMEVQIVLIKHINSTTHPNLDIHLNGDWIELSWTKTYYRIVCHTEAANVNDLYSNEKPMFYSLGRHFNENNEFWLDCSCN